MLSFCWKKNDLIPHQLFSKVDMGIGCDVTQPPNPMPTPQVILARRYIKLFQALTIMDNYINHTVATVKLLIMDVPPFGYGKIITIEIGILANLHPYQVTIGNFSSCNCLYFINMFTTTLGKRGKWVPCKHSY